MKDEVASLRLRVKALEGGQVAESQPAVAKKAKKEKDPDAPKKAPSKWAIALQEVYMPVIKKALGDEKLPKGLSHMQVAGYLNKQGKTEPTTEDVKSAIQFLESNPDYKSDTQKTRSESGSVKEDAPAKKRGRPSKAKAEKDAKAEKAVPKVVTPKAEKAADADEEKLSPSWDDEEVKVEKAEEEFQAPDLVVLNFKGVDYLRDPEDDEVYTADGDMKWLGTWTGKKIVKGEMSERVKKVLASQE